MEKKKMNGKDKYIKILQLFFPYNRIDKLRNGNYEIYFTTGEYHCSTIMTKKYLNHLSKKWSDDISFIQTEERDKILEICKIEKTRAHQTLKRKFISEFLENDKDGEIITPLIGCNKQVIIRHPNCLNYA